MGSSKLLLERLKNKKSYADFMKNNPDSFLYAVFCIISQNEREGDKIQFDFYSPKLKKIAHTEYPFDELKIQEYDSNINSKKLDLNSMTIDIENLWDKIIEIQKDKKNNLTINKSMCVLRNQIWELVCTTASLDMLKIKINAETGECIEYKKENLTDFIQIKKTNQKS